jgi:putative DNA primase/helicase
MTEISPALTALAQELQSPSLQIIKASDVTQKVVQWLWLNRIARGKLTLIAGDPGLGKSQIGIDLIARLTTGAAWPDGSTAPVGSCIVLASEDAADDTICPRLELAGANLEKVRIVQSVIEKGEQRGFSLQRDLDALTVTAKEIGDVIFISIDPITAYLGTDVDSHRTADVRSVLVRLEHFASEHNIAAFAITHPPKAAQSKAINSFTGSLAFVASARLAFVAVEEAETDRHLMLAVKNNLGPKADGLGYRLAQGATPAGIITSRVVWDSAPVTVTANEAIHAAAEQNRKGEARREAEAFLEAYLEAGPMPQEKVAGAAKANGISERTLRRAREGLKIIVEKAGYEGGWVWRLPS